MNKRRFLRPRELAPLLKVRRPELSPRRRRLRAALTIDDLRTAAKRRAPRAAFDFTDGGADAEISLRRARDSFRDIEFHPEILRPVAEADMSVEVLGSKALLPFGIAPTGFTRMMHAEGEVAGIQAAHAAGIPFALSTMGTTSIEDLATACPEGRKWFQLYVWKDRERSVNLVKRAAAAGFDTLLVTVDVPVAGARLRDRRNGMTLPPALTLRTILDAARRPAWWFDFLTTEPLSFASLDRWPGTIAELLDAMFDPTVGYNDLLWLKDLWPGKLVVKGVQTVEDARRVTQLGVDAIVLSNHGGRQLDRAPTPFRLLPEVVREVGQDTEIILDTGITHGSDIVAALALGANFTIVGRAYLYGLMAGGRQGVDRAIEILADEIARTMRLLGASCVAELKPQHVTQLPRGERSTAFN